MQATNIKRGALAAGFMLWCCVRAAAQGPPPLDTARIVSAALEAFTTANGPIVEIVEHHGCIAPLGKPVDGSPAKCTTSAVDSAIFAFAEKRSLTVVTKSKSFAICAWNPHQVPGHTRGTRMSVYEPERSRAGAHVKVEIKCVSRTGFGHWVIYEVRQIDGVWKVTRTVETMIS